MNNLSQGKKGSGVGNEQKGWTSWFQEAACWLDVGDSTLQFQYWKTVDREEWEWRHDSSGFPTPNQTLAVQLEFWGQS